MNRIWKRTRPATRGEYGINVGSGDRKPKRNLPEEVRLNVLLKNVVEAAEDVLRVHGKRCECSLCEDAQGIAYNARIAHDLTGSILYGDDADKYGCPVCGGRNHGDV